jgi:hypothetical protein
MASYGLQSCTEGDWLSCLRKIHNQPQKLRCSSKSRKLVDEGAVNASYWKLLIRVSNPNVALKIIARTWES